MNWQSFADAVDTSLATYPPGPISLRDKVMRVNRKLPLLYAAPQLFLRLENEVVHNFLQGDF